MKEKTGASMKSFKLPFAIAVAFLLVSTRDAFAWRDMSQHIYPIPPSFLTATLVIWLGAISIAMASYFAGHWRDWHRSVQPSHMHSDYLALAICLPLVLIFLPGSPRAGVWLSTAVWLGGASAAICAGWALVRLLSHRSGLKKYIRDGLLILLMVGGLAAYYYFLFGMKKIPNRMLETFAVYGLMLLNLASVYAAYKLMLLYKRTRMREALLGFVIIVMLFALANSLLPLGKIIRRFDAKLGVFYTLAFFLVPYVIYRLVIRLPDKWRIRLSTTLLVTVTLMFFVTAVKSDYVPKMLKYAEEKASFQKKRPMTPMPSPRIPGDCPTCGMG